VRKAAVERELDEELRDHLEREAGRQRALGVDHRRAGEAARRRFGSLEAVRERCRDARGVTFVDTLRQDLLYGERCAARRPSPSRRRSPSASARAPPSSASSTACWWRRCHSRIPVVWAERRQPAARPGSCGLDQLLPVDTPRLDEVSIN